ncbi:MAG: hypothetical protein PHT16_03745 [Candidatus Pacebacteria bacterium]|nr:hypothetical protein [Candidatus Paceibacterota bacterium]
METVNQNPVLQNTFFDSKYFDPTYLFDQGTIYFHNFINNLSIASFGQISVFTKTILFFLAMFFLTIICYVIVRMLEIRAKEHKHLHHEIHEYALKKAEREKRQREETGGSKNERWSKTLSYLFSQHASDWKLAIIEADSMLESLMEQLGFRGETLGDRLKNANQENFPNLTIAWEVHTIRNRIAHEGLDFEVSQHEAKRVIALYEQIFHEYGYI